jgi:hypothetical protein
MQPVVVAALRREGHEVYDFHEWGFSWSEIDPDWKLWSSEDFRRVLNQERVSNNFWSDMNALARCDTCVLVAPCGRSSHLELGWAAGAGRKTAILLSDGEPELMYKMANVLCTSLDELMKWCRGG